MSLTYKPQRKSSKYEVLFQRAADDGNAALYEY